jgi:hypothetical protein
MANARREAESRLPDFGQLQRLTTQSRQHTTPFPEILWMHLGYLGVIGRGSVTGLGPRKLSNTVRPGCEQMEGSVGGPLVGPYCFRCYTKWDSALAAALY